MFWRRLSGASYEFVAVTSFRQIRHDKHLYGKREYVFDLADGSKESTVFEPEQWQRLEQGLGSGGLVANA